jgi:DNA polymerase I-like protein with 3'-5' exonuclease and polymerase domains/uracil-DNA glycosylase
MHPTGPSNAKMMIVGDFPAPIDVSRGMPFSGPAGYELDRMLHNAGIMRTACFVTNLCEHSPLGWDPYAWIEMKKKPRASGLVPWHDGWAHPKVAEGEAAMWRHIELVKPTVVLALGNAPLKALTGKWAVSSWRGSTLQGRSPSGHQFIVIPSYTPGAVQRDWSLRAPTVQDFRRAQDCVLAGSGVVPVPNKRFIIRPNFEQATQYLLRLILRLEEEPIPISCDIETRAGHIACVGYATSKHEAICIPLMCVERPDGYWDPLQEKVIWDLIRQLHRHPNARLFGQNFLYDAQYFYRFMFLDTPIWFDTMVAQHCIFPGTPKSLDYLASLYNKHYVYWKDDSKEWAGKMGEDQLWVYNCDDCIHTFEIMEAQWQILLSDARLHSVWTFQQNTLVPRLFQAMNRGVRADVRGKKRLASELQKEIEVREAWLLEVTGQPLNIKSPKQMQAFFYNDCQFKPVISRKTGNPTVDDKALESIAAKEPAVRPVIRRIQELRSLGVFLSTFVEAQLDRDQRIRSSYNPAGTETFRLSSSTNAFWSGMNLQNIPKGDEEGDDPNALRLPNIRKLFIPDEGMIMFDMDLNRADLEVVVAEAEDAEMFQAMRSGIDMHSLNAKELFGLSCPLGEVKTRHNDKRQMAKQWVHGTNYGGGPRTMAKTCGLTIREAEKLRERWFQIHPGIERWHRRQEALLQSHHWAENRFGYRYTFFDRIDGALPEALAWVPQSTVACVINRAWDQILRQVPGVEILIQVHDSLVGQFPASMADTIPAAILAAAAVPIPYPTPLTIEASIATSSVSWGDCK